MRPSDPEEEKRPDRTIDWITFKFFNQDSRVLSAHVKTVRGGGLNRISCYDKQKHSHNTSTMTAAAARAVALAVDNNPTSLSAVDNLHPPSDHMPVIAIFEIFAPTAD